MARGTKKSIEALEQKFETQKKPTQQDFFDMMSSFYHKDEDLAFLISLSKATLTDAQAGEDHSRFMTALRTYQAIEYWGRLGKLANLYSDVNTLIMQRIGEMWNTLLATNDSDNVINTLGEIFLVLQNFNEWTGGIKSEFDFFHSVLRDLSGERVVKNTFENHNSRLSNVESRLLDVPNNPRQVQNNFDSLFSILRDMTGDRVVKTTFENIQSVLQDMTGARVVKTTFETIQALLVDLSGTRAIMNIFDSHNTRINTAQTKADDAFTLAQTAKTRADDAHTIINRPEGSTEKVWDRITGVYSYATTVAGVVNLIETTLSGYTLGSSGAIKNDVNYVNGRVDDLYTKHSTQQSQLDYVQGFTSTLMGYIESLNMRYDAIITKLTSLGYWP